MASRREKMVKRLLSSLNVDKNPSGTPGPRISEFTRSHSKKDRKRKGRVEARLLKPQMKWKEVHEEGIEPEKYWDDWTSPHDGFRFGTNQDQLHHKWMAHGQKKEYIYDKNNKIRKHIRVRKAKLLRKKGKPLKELPYNDSLITTNK
jgi:hypothetical protein